MTNKIVIPIVLLIFLAGYSQTIKLKGRVVDSSAAPLGGVTVSLLKAGKSDVTDAEGNFLIENNPSGIYLKGENQSFDNMTVKGNELSFFLNANRSVSIDLLNIHGQLMYHVFTGTAENGKNQFLLPSSGLSP
ncbi:MAG: carboxypeptidase-like regulatory domain-containing protein [Fibrobacteria bacterium]|nr:carboxypeptidase-like regulatory domain-containing protein [Fibrobacteria bacterium]